MSGATVTIIGATGFIGRQLQRTLAKLDLPPQTTLRLLSRTPPASRPVTPSALATTHVECDVTDAASLAPALAGTTHAINLVGLLHESGSPGGTRSFSAVHATAARRTAELAAALPALRAVVHVSAIGADAESGSAYARTKAEGEAAFTSLAEQRPDVAVSVLRPSLVFGPEDAFFNRFARLAAVMPFLPLVGGGVTKFQPVHVADVAHAITARLALPGRDGHAGRSASASASEDGTAAPADRAREMAPESPEPVVGVFELGGANVMTFRELMELVLQVSERRRLLLPIPFALAYAQGALFEALHRAVPSVAPLLTRDQVELLQHDNVVAASARGFKHLGIEPQACNAESVSFIRRQ